MDRDEHVENLIDSIDKQVDFDLRHQEVVNSVLYGRCFTADELLDVWNEEDLEQQPSA